MNAPDPAVLAEADDLVTDAVVRRCFGVGPVEDPSGLLGQPSRMPSAEASEDEQFASYMQQHFGVAAAPVSQPGPAPGPNVGTDAMPAIHQGPRGPAADDDTAFMDAWMKTYFPGSVG